MPEVPQPIDAVITWVDGKAYSHRQKLETYLQQECIERPKSAAPTRYNSCGELIYSISSLLRFAPWLRTIYIVTDSQTPPIWPTLQNTPFKDKIRLIDHQVIFSGFSSYLPTFNSLSIEAMIWRIPGLSEHFLYCNDDCMLLRPVKPEHFFSHGKLVVRGTWKVQAKNKWRYQIRRLLAEWLPVSTDIPENTHRVLQENTARILGYERQFFHLPHVIFPLKKSIFVDYFADKQTLLEKNIAHKFRHVSQFWPISLAYHLAMQNNLACIDKHSQDIMINGETHTYKKIQARLTKSTQSDNFMFLCVQGLDQAPNTVQDYILTWLKEHVGEIVIDLKRSI